MTYNLLRKFVMDFLSRSRMSIEITGFDPDAFSKAVNRELKDNLDTIEYIIFEDDDILSSEEKIASIQELFRRNC